MWELGVDDADAGGVDCSASASLHLDWGPLADAAADGADSQAAGCDGGGDSSDGWGWGSEGHAPINIYGGPLKAIDFDTPIPSAQVKTAVLFAGLQAVGTTSLSESVRTRDHSEHALRAFGAELVRTGERLMIPGGQKLDGD